MKIQVRLAMGLVVWSGICANAQVFDWENLPSTGVFTNISQTSNGITAVASGHNGTVQVADWWALGWSNMAPFGRRSFGGGQQSTGFGPIRVDFSIDLSSVTVSFGDGPPDDDGIITVSAYSRSDALLDTASYPYHSTDGPASITVTGNGIAYFTGSCTELGTLPYTFTWDNFSVTPVSEPLTSIGLALGTAFIAISNRKK